VKVSSAERDRRGSVASVDHVDRCLLDALRANARATYAELARAVGLSAPAVHERVAKLEASGVITGYHAAVRPESLGYAMNALVGIFLSDSADSDDVAGMLACLPEVEHCWFVAGEETFVVKIRVPDVAGLEGAIRALNSIKGVARTRTTVVLSTKFEDRAWQPARPTAAAGPPPSGAEAEVTDPSADRP
jgi:Lrp/AsnC family transcriptional regulator, leucine-responsive regulatory protein